MKRLLAFLLLAVPLYAQTDAVPQSLLTVGVTATDAGGAPWAYLTWRSAPGTLAYGQPLAIFVKNAAAGAGGTFEQAGTTQLATELAIVKTHVSRAAALGADGALLAGDVYAYYEVVRNNHQALKDGQTLTPVNLSIEEKIARLVQQARTDARTAATLKRISEVHPAIALCAGNAWAGRLTAAVGQVVTIEVRPCDPVSGQAGGVVARTSFNAGQPETMLAPGAPVQVPDLTPEGDRVVKLRWATPDTLRRQFPMLRGFHLYRSPKLEAEARNWHVTPPSLAALRSAMADPAVVRRIAESPINAGKLFSALTVANFAPDGPNDLVTYYFLDDNNRFARDAAGNITGTTHADGAAFYYFATASDLLGREGAVSPAGPGTACIRIPPPIPANITLTEDNITPANGTTPHMGLRLTWTANVRADDNDTDFYEILRGSQADTPNADFARPETLPAPIAVLPHAPGPDGKMSWRDATLPQNGNGTATYWYSIRARHVSPCPPDNTSRPSAPLFGTVRTYLAPAAPAGTSMITCPLAGLYVPQFSHGFVPGETFVEPLVQPAPQANMKRVLLEAVRRDAGIDWVELKWTWNTQSPAAEFERYEFGSDNQLLIPCDVPAFNGDVTLHMRAGSATGATSRLVSESTNMASLTGWNETNQLRIKTVAGFYALSEIRREDGRANVIFDLTAHEISAAGRTALPDSCYSVAAARADHTPVIVSRHLGNEIVTVDGVEVMGGRFVFCDAAYNPAATYRAWIPQAGNVVCQHQADAADGTIRPIRVRMGIPLNAGEYRIYRSVDDGPLTLLAQGDGSRLPAGATEVVREDKTLPANAGFAKYFGQTFNRAGIGSAMVPLGDRILLGRRDLAAPQLKRPLASGTAAAPAVRLEWFCPPDGIERFEVRFAPKGQGSAGTNLPSGGPLLLKAISMQTKAGRDAQGRLIFRKVIQTALTPLVGEVLGSGPVFSVTQPVRTQKQYAVSVRAISLSGYAGPWSEPRDFQWDVPVPPPAPGPEPRVPWPARALPPVRDWSPLVQATALRMFNDSTSEHNKIWAPWHAGEYPVGVRIARMAVQPDTSLPTVLTHFPDFPTVLANGRSIMRLSSRRLMNYRGSDPWQYLIRDGATAGDPLFTVDGASPPPPGQPLLPAVLYRQQLANARYPSVTGDTIQVSPLIEKIAHGVVFPGNVETESVILRDPYIGVVSSEPAPNSVTGVLVDLHILDTQPVKKGALYRYSLVRLRADNGEIDEVIPAGDVTIPDNL